MEKKTRNPEENKAARTKKCRKKACHACDIRQAVATHVKQWRICKRIPMKTMAADMGVSITIISDWEEGRRFPSVENAANLANYMNIPICRLICREDCPALEPGHRD